MSAPPAVIPARKLAGRVTTVLTTKAMGRLGFQSQPVAALHLDLEGITDNRHRGWTRTSDARVPYLPRGTVIRNERQVSLVSAEDLTEIARRLAIPQLDPRWIGANIVVCGMIDFSYLPRGTHLLFPGGAILIITDQNAPCALSGDAIAHQVPDRPEIKPKFAKVAQGLRGVVATVERGGSVEPGVAFDARLPAQWLYPIGPAPSRKRTSD
jgi:MOSC domain